MNKFKRGLNPKESLQIGIHRFKNSFLGYNYIKFPFMVKSIKDENGKDLLGCFIADFFFPPKGLKILIINDQYKYFGDEQGGNVCYDHSGNGFHAIRC